MEYHICFLLSQNNKEFITPLQLRTSIPSSKQRKTIWVWGTLKHPVSSCVTTGRWSLVDGGWVSGGMPLGELWVSGTFYPLSPLPGCEEVSNCLHHNELPSHRPQSSHGLKALTPWTAVLFPLPCCSAG